MTYENRHTEAEHSAQGAIDLARQELLEAIELPPDWDSLSAEQQRRLRRIRLINLEARRGNRAPLDQLRREGHF